MSIVTIISHKPASTSGRAMTSGNDRNEFDNEADAIAHIKSIFASEAKNGINEPADPGTSES